MTLWQILDLKNRSSLLPVLWFSAWYPERKTRIDVYFKSLFLWELMNSQGSPSIKDALSVSGWHPAHLCPWVKAYCWKKKPTDFSGFTEQCILLTSSVGRWIGTGAPAFTGKKHILFNCQSWCLLLHPLPAARKWGRKVSLAHLSYLWAKPRSGHMPFVHIPHHQNLNTCKRV